MAIDRVSIRLSLIILVAIFCAVPYLSAQQPPQATALPVYDVVSIHENKSAANIVRIQTQDANFTATNVPLSNLISMAYDIRLDLISSLPAWANSSRFDISAKVSDPDIAALNKLSRAQHHAMLVTLLADRFHLKAHTETKTLPVYDLVIAKSGSKLTENKTVPAPDSPATGPRNLKPGSMWLGNDGSSTELTAVGIPTSSLATNLALQVQRNVIDKTGLTSKYDFTLKWTPTEMQGKTDGDNNAPDLFTALQEQLGVKLEPSKGPVETLVIDHVEMPSEN